MPMASCGNFSPYSSGSKLEFQSDLVRMRLGYEAEDSHWGIALVGDNVTDEEYYVERFLFLDVANRRAPGAL